VGGFAALFILRRDSQTALPKFFCQFFVRTKYCLVNCCNTITGNEERINAVILLRDYEAINSAKLFATNQKDLFRIFSLQKFSLAVSSIEGVHFDSLRMPSKKLLRLI
jgi:hypothetical protein